MTYTVTTSLSEFPAWEGAKDNLNTLREKGAAALETVENFIDESFQNPTQTDINDYLWFYVEEDFPEFFKDDSE